MKKPLLGLVLAMVIVGGVFAQEQEEWPKHWYKPDLVGRAGLLTGFEYYKTTSDFGDSKQTAVPILLFADAVYLSIHFGISFIDAKDVADYSLDGTYLGQTDTTRIYLPLGLMFKYPLTFGTKRNIRIFPQAGIEYRIFLADDVAVRKDYDTIMSLLEIDNYSFNYLDQFSILAGIGVDFDLPAMGSADGLFIHLNGLADIQVPSKVERDNDDSVRHGGFKLQLAVGVKAPVNK